MRSRSAWQRAVRPSPMIILLMSLIGGLMAVGFSQTRSVIKPLSMLTPPAYLGEWGSFGSDTGKFQYPQKIAITSAGELVVADAGNNRLQVFDTTGKFLRTIGLPGGTTGEQVGALYNSSGVAVDSDGNIYATDLREERVQVFDSTGKFVSAAKVPAAAVTACGGAIFTVGKTEHVVTKLTPTLDTTKTFGGFGTATGQLQFPTGITCAGTSLIVADMVGARVQVFDLDGNALQAFGTFGNGSGQFNNPYDVAVDPQHNIYVVDMSNHRVQVFNSQGQYLTTLGSGFGSGPGQFKYPTGITIDRQGTIYVVDGGNHRVQKFAPLR